MKDKGENGHIHCTSGQELYIRLISPYWCPFSFLYSNENFFIIFIICGTNLSL